MRVPFDRYDVGYIAVPLAVSGIVGLASELSPYPPRTDLIYALEGTIVEALQFHLHPVLTTLFVGVYLLVYPVFLLSTYIGLKRHHGRSRALDYVTTYTAVLLVSTPIFYFVPVGVTGYYLQGVQPVLYESTGAIQTFMKSVDTLQKALPSLHAGLAGTASLYAPDGYEWPSWTITCLILMSTLYLGIHWLTDLVIGLALAYGCYLATPTVRSYLNRFRVQSELAAISDD